MQANLFNNIPKHLVRELKKGETAVYRITDIKPDPHNAGKFLIPFSRNVPSTDEVYDPKTGEFYPIAYIDRVLPDGEAVLGDISLTKSMAGTLILRGDNPVDRKKYQYLELTNYNVSNKDRISGKQDIIKKIDTESDARLEREQRRESAKALTKAMELTLDEVRGIASSLGFSLAAKEAVLRNKVEEFAEDSPSEFLAIASQQSNKMESLLREAIDLGIISHDQKSGKFVWKESKEEFFSYERSVGVKPYELCAEFLLTVDGETQEAIANRVLAKRDNS